MSPFDLQRLQQLNAKTLLDALSIRQYLHPHRPLRQILTDAQADLGFCPEAARHALEWLRLDPSVAVGRLRRGELIQLARSIHRYWRQSLPLDALPT